MKNDTLPGWAELPEEFAETWEASGPFVEITADEDGNITGMTPAEEVLPGNQEENAEPSEPTDTEVLNALLGVTE